MVPRRIRTPNVVSENCGLGRAVTGVYSITGVFKLGLNVGWLGTGSLERRHHRLKMASVIRIPTCNTQFRAGGLFNLQEPLPSFSYVHDNPH